MLFLWFEFQFEFHGKQSYIAVCVPFMHYIVFYFQDKPVKTVSMFSLPQHRALHVNGVKTCLMPG